MNVPKYPSGPVVSDYAAVLLVDAVAAHGEHTLGKRAEALTKVYAFGVGENLDRTRLGSVPWWAIVSEALQQGLDLHPTLSTRQRALVEAQIDLATERGTPPPEAKVNALKAAGLPEDEVALQGFVKGAARPTPVPPPAVAQAEALDAVTAAQVARPLL